MQELEEKRKSPDRSLHSTSLFKKRKKDWRKFNFCFDFFSLPAPLSPSLFLHYCYLRAGSFEFPPSSPHRNPGKVQSERQARGGRSVFVRARADAYFILILQFLQLLDFNPFSLAASPPQPSPTLSVSVRCFFLWCARMPRGEFLMWSLSW